MSKPIKELFSKITADYDVAEKVGSALTSGSRILPSKTTKNDANYQLRLDAGAMIDEQYRNVVLQVNSQAKSTGLREWLKKQPQGTHAKLATARFDTLAEDKDAEIKKFLNELEEQAIDHL